MNHVSTRTIESKAFPGARFTIKRMAKRRVDALDELQAASRDKLKPLYEEFLPLDKDRREAGDAFPAEKVKQWAELWSQINKIDQNEMAPVAARFCLVRIEGLEITYPDAAGVDHTDPATLDLMMEHGPDELYQEILHEVKRECGLLPEEIVNLKLPSTSAAAVDGTPETAAPVETPATTILSAA